MSLTLRHRIFLTLVPLLLLLAVVGSAGVTLLLRLGNSINEILRENYKSVIAMERLNESLERIDSSFQIVMSGRDDQELLTKARAKYEANWKSYLRELDVEQKNITVEGEEALVRQLESLTEEYRSRGEAFYADLGNETKLREAYYGKPSGLLATFGQIKDVSGKILRLNQENMEDAGSRARKW